MFLLVLILRSPNSPKISLRRLLPQSDARRRLTPRSSGAPTAGHQARAGGTRYIFTSPGLASCRRRPLSSNVSALVSLRQGTALCQICLLASATTALCQLRQGRLFCRLLEPTALSLPRQSRWLRRSSKVPARPQLRQRRFRAIAPAGQNARKIQCQVCSVIRQEQYTRSWCALRRWCQVAFKNALSGVPSSALTLSMNP